MIWQHLSAFVWLRWRILYNQARRAGAFNAVLMMIVFVAALCTAVPLFFGCFTLGIYMIPRASAAVLMYVWDGLVAGFLMFWCIGLLTELQRTESLALSKFLHLPVSPNGAFMINYVSSLLRLSMIVFVPMMLGYALALVWVKGPALLPALPLLGAFLLMVTALTYQFQGWLASLMSNPRRRRTVVVIATTLFILIFQLPNLLNFLAPWGGGVGEARAAQARSQAMLAELKALAKQSETREIDAAEYAKRVQEVSERYKKANEARAHATQQQFERAAWLLNVVLPIGWLPLGVESAAEGRFVPWLLGLAGMTAIGSISLRRAYRTTVGQYQEQPSNAQVRRAAALAATAATAAAQPAEATPRREQFLEARLPGMSEPVSAVALASLRGLLRAPEAKMILLSPLITAVIFGSMLWKGRQGIPAVVRPQIALGAMVFVLLGTLQIAANQFGFDRDGFRVFVLCAARRRDILIGKNLAFAPVALGMAAVQLVVVQLVCPLRVDHFLAMVPLYISMFLMFCLFANVASIYAPMQIAAGTLKGSNLSFTTGLLQFIFFVFLFPVAIAPAFLPLGLEWMLWLMDLTAGLPVGLLLSVAECAVIVVIYRVVVGWQGDLFQSREQRILEVVTSRPG